LAWRPAAVCVLWGSHSAWALRAVNAGEPLTEHTKGVESFWSLLERPHRGTYVSVEPFHLFLYLDEQAFRFNERKDVRESARIEAGVGRLFT